jgi:hypothetical protein
VNPSSHVKSAEPVPYLTPLASFDPASPPTINMTTMAIIKRQVIKGKNFVPA